jgi:hypothetical protein
MAELAERLGVTGWPRIVAQGSTDVAGIAAAMAEVAGSPETYGLAAQEASRSATDLFACQGSERLIALYRELLDLRSPSTAAR